MKERKKYKIKKHTKVQDAFMTIKKNKMDQGKTYEKN